MAVCGSVVVFVVAVCRAAYSLLSGYGFSYDRAEGESGGAGRVQFTGGGSGKRDGGGAIF